MQKYSQNSQVFDNRALYWDRRSYRSRYRSPYQIIMSLRKHLLEIKAQWSIIPRKISEFIGKTCSITKLLVKQGYHRSYRSQYRSPYQIIIFVTRKTPSRNKRNKINNFRKNLKIYRLNFSNIGALRSAEGQKVLQLTVQIPLSNNNVSMEAPSRN